MEQRFKRVRKQLDDLGYMQILIPEALPLVEKLTLDLIQTTESLQKYKKIAKNALEERNTLEFGAEPYKCDNAKLVKECNDLHLAFLQYREKSEKFQKDLKRRTASLERDKVECGSQCEKLKKRITDLELESARKTDRIIALQSKSLQAGSKTSFKSCSITTSKPKSIPTSKTNIEISTTMALADQKIANLTKEIQKLKDEQLHLSEINDSYKNQINNRDKEIERLTRMLEGGRPSAALNKDCCYKDAEGKVASLQNNVRSLEKEKKELEVRLKEAIAKQHEAMKRALTLADRNKQLEHELRDIDQMALAVEADCNTTVKNNAEKVNRLQEKVHETVLEIQSLEREVMDLKHDKQELQADLDAVKLEKKHLQNVLETALEEKKRLNDKINQFTVIEHDLNLEIDRLVQASANQKRRIAELECKVLTEKFDAITEHSTVPDVTSDRFKSNRNYYTREYHRVSEQLKNVSSNPDNNAELTQKLQEKDQEIATLQHKNKMLAQEKHNLMTRLESTRNVVESDYDVFSARSSIKRAERERDMFKGDMQRLEEERDALRQRVQIIMESQVAECSKLEMNLFQSEEQCRKLEQERHDLIQSQGTRRATINNLEAQCETMKDQLQMSTTELNHQRTLYTQLKSLHEQTDKALADTQGQLMQVEAELAVSQERILSYEKNNVYDEMNAMRSDISTLKGRLAQMDREKDGLMISLDDKTERIAMLEHDIKQKESNITILDGQVADMKKKLNKSAENTISREQMLKSNSTEVSNLRQELETMSRVKESMVQENRRLQDDVAASTADCRRAQNEVEQTKRQVEDLKRQLQHYVSEVRRFEDLMEQKELERSELLDQFRSLSQEANLLENNNHSLENEATQSKVQLSVTLDHVSEIEKQLTIQDDKISDYEKQISELTLQVTNFEIQLAQCKQNQERTDAEVVSLQTLCMKLDHQKDELIRELNEKNDERAQVDKSILRMQRDSETLQKTLSRDRSSTENLERLLAEARDEVVKQKLLNQELKAEIETLKAKIEESQKKLSSTANNGMFTYSTNLASRVENGMYNCCKNCPGSDKGGILDTASLSFGKECKCCGECEEKKSKNENKKIYEIDKYKSLYASNLPTKLMPNNDASEKGSLYKCRHYTPFDLKNVNQSHSSMQRSCTYSDVSKTNQDQFQSNATLNKY